MGKNPNEISASDFMKALQNIRSSDEQVRIESIEIIGDTIGFLNDETLEIGAVILLGAILDQKDENKKVKDAARTALRKIEDRCKYINDKMELSILALTYRQENQSKKKIKPYVFVLIVIAIVLVILFIICMGSGLVLFLGN